MFLLCHGDRVCPQESFKWIEDPAGEIKTIATTSGIFVGAIVEECENYLNEKMVNILSDSNCCFYKTHVAMLRFCFERDATSFKGCSENTFAERAVIIVNT